jgi:plastocyanin
MSRSRLAPAALVAALAVAVAPALAAEDRTITASDYRYTPDAVTIAPGDRVVFANSGGTHNFSFADGAEYPAIPAPQDDGFWSGPVEARSRTFTEPGRTYAFRCDQHPDEMNGTITVTAPAPPTPTPTATPSPTATPAPAPDAGGGAPPAVRVRTFAAAARSFCVRRGPTCRRPGVRVRIDLSGAARVRGVLRRGGRRFGRVDFGTVPAGPRTLRFRRTTAGRRLAAGRYVLTATIDGAGSRTLRFRVR